jgi:hypothetical protein
LGLRAAPQATMRFIDAIANPKDYAPMEPRARVRDLIESHAAIRRRG